MTLLRWRSRLVLLALLFAIPAPALAAEAGEGILIDHVWAGHPVGFELLVERGHQFIAYFDAERRLTVTGRKLGDDNWVRVQPEGVPVPRRERLSNVTGWDSHNRLAMALDRDGCLHLSGNMHADPLVYYRMRQAFDLTTLERLDRMTGSGEQRVTYPHFFTSTAGDLHFRYRDGGSGNGSDFYNTYDPDTRTWRRLFDGPLLEGEGERSAYGTGPQRGPDGRYHMVWMWRDTPDAMSNHTLSYARSADLVQWETSMGRPVPRPITMSHAEVVDPAGPGGGLVNMTYALGWDAEQRPVVAYHRYGEDGQSQIFVARADGAGGWQSRQVSDWGFRWEFPGGGSQVREVSVGRPTPDADGNLLVEFSARQAGSGRWKLDGSTLAVLDQLPAVRRDTSEVSPRPRGDFPGLQVRTQSAVADGSRWMLRWETLGVNRDLANRDVPPPSELRLHEFPAEE